MNLSLEKALGQMILGSFDGSQAPQEVLEAVRRGRLGGVTLFRGRNLDTPQGAQDLTARLQSAAQEGGNPPLLIAADQEGGQLMAIGEGATEFPGNLALGAAGSEDLAQRVGYALGRELSAMGINLNYAPVCDVNVNPANPVVGTRSFGEDPGLAARLASAQVRGLQKAGVAATAKHFPGHGDTAIDSHYGTPVLEHNLERLRRVELPPFVEAIRAGVKAVMAGHLALPALNQGLDIPATLSPAILQGLLRDELGFQGVIVSDAMNMGAIRQDDGLVIDVITAVAAGMDLLLLAGPFHESGRVYEALAQACRRGLLNPKRVKESAGRVLALKNWLPRGSQPDLEVVGCSEHHKLALQAAREAITLVRDRDGILPLRLSPEDSIGVVLPQPEDLTPADTSSYLRPEMVEALRGFHPRVEERVTAIDPDEEEIAELRQWASSFEVLVVGTINASAHPGQVKLVKALNSLEASLVVAALRMPYDLAYFHSVGAYVCTYSIQKPAMQALAEGLFGRTPWAGALPVSIEGIAPRGYPYPPG